MNDPAKSVSEKYWNQATTVLNRRQRGGDGVCARKGASQTGVPRRVGHSADYPVEPGKDYPPSIKLTFTSTNGMSLHMNRSAIAMFATLTLALSILSPAPPASAATYQDFYSVSCTGTALCRITSSTTGFTEHFRDGVRTAYWSNGNTRSTRISTKSKSINHASVETSGSYAWLYSASISCYCAAPCGS